MKTYSEMTRNERDNLIGNIVAWVLIGCTVGTVFMVLFGNHL